MTGAHSTSEYRDVVELDGTWEFVTDPNETGVEDAWASVGAEWPGRTRKVTVPHAWQELDAYREYTGTAWYRRSFDLDEDRSSDGDAFLRFDAVDHESTVWVNGERARHNSGGFLPFEVDVTDLLTERENVVVVRVDDPADITEIPHGKQGDPWYTRVSGIWQSVRLSLRPPSCVVSAEVTPNLAAETADVRVDVRPGPRAEADLSCEIRASRDGDVVSIARCDAGDSAYGVLDFEDPDYWSPEQPNLYDLEVRLYHDGNCVDQYEDYFGFRSFETRDGQFLLNGEPITIRGVLEQGYYPKTLYRPPAEDTFEHEVSVAKELGFNLIRKHVKPAHPDFVEAADRLGILVWQEPANPTVYTNTSREAVMDQLHGLVDRDYNRPSVVIWGIYNEEWGIGHADGEETLWTDETKQTFLADCYRSTRERDPTRVVCDNSGWSHVATDVNDFHRYFASPDRAETWVDDLNHICQFPGDNYATTNFDDPDSPVVVSELGTWGLGDLSALRDHYDGDPPWFFHEFLTPDLKRPAGVDERFASTDLPAVFDGFDEFEAAWQRREFVSNKHLIDQLRVHEDVAGYVLTQLSDIEWEFNGILDYLREEKQFHDQFAAVNDPLSVIADPSSHVCWTGDSFDLDLFVVNDTGRTVDGSIEWQFADEEESASVAVDPHSVDRIETNVEGHPTFEDGVGTEELVVTLRSEEETRSTREPITVVDRSASGIPGGTVFAEGALAARFAREGIDVRHEVGDDVDVAFTDEVTNALMQFAAGGGHVIQIPSPDGRLRDGGPFEYAEVPERESWFSAASFYYQDSPLLADLCEDTRLGWEFESLYPLAVASGLDATEDRVHVGYVQGWVENWASPLVTRDHGAGSFTACTFRIPEKYGDHPVATLLCNRILRFLVA